MITKKYGVDFTSYNGGALTLSPDYVGDNESGWNITGKIEEAYHEYMWVTNFYAEHPQYGKVWGNFQDEVFADSENGYDHFYQHHEPNDWDYDEI